MSKLEMFALDDNPKLSILEFENEEDWLKIRTKGIGGSDVGAIMGINKYASPLSIYKQKVEGYVKDMSDNPYVKKGKDLEDLILQNYVKPYFIKKGYTVYKPDFMIVNEDMPWLRANLDGIACSIVKKSYTQNLVVEIKWVSEYAEVNWNNDDEYLGVPPSYYAQVQLYMAVIGAKEAYICALFDSNWEMHYYRIPRNDLFILKMLGATKKFYDVHMMTKIPPLVSFTMDKEDIVEDVKSIPEPTIPSPVLSDLIRKYKDIKSQIKEAEKFKDKVTDLIYNHCQKGEYPDDKTLKVTMSTVKQRRFNATKFKVDRPDLYEQYCEDSEYSKMNIK